MTYNKDILAVNFDDFIQSGSTVYSDGDVAIIRNAKELDIEKKLLLEMMVIGFCEKGKIVLEINGEGKNLGANDLVLLPPNTVIDNIMVSTDVEFKAIGASYEALRSNAHVGKATWELLHYISKCPVLKVKQEDVMLMNAYYDLLVLKMSDKETIYYREVMSRLRDAVYYEFLSKIIPLAQEAGGGEETSLSGQICKRFFYLLSKSEGRERSVTKLAAQMHITPKHLSTVVKSESGKTALTWIHLYTANVIEQRLKYTDQPVKEIANDLKFSSLSFFGKFVKAHLGVSPKEYRKRNVEGK